MLRSTVARASVLVATLAAVHPASVIQPIAEIDPGADPASAGTGRGRSRQEYDRSLELRMYLMFVIAGGALLPPLIRACWAAVLICRGKPRPWRQQPQAPVAWLARRVAEYLFGPTARLIERKLPGIGDGTTTHNRANDHDLFSFWNEHQNQPSTLPEIKGVVEASPSSFCSFPPSSPEST